MKLPMFCTQCAADPSQQDTTFLLVDPREDGLYQFECPQKHQCVIALAQDKFELFFEAGVFAIADEYYRDAIVSFTSAVECFHEFAVNALLMELADDVSTSMWEVAARRSERLLGAFVILWVQKFKTQPVLLSTGMTELRNKVVHRGKFADLADATRYGKAVLEVLQANLSALLEKAGGAIVKVKRRRIEAHERSGVALDTVMAYPTLVRAEPSWKSPWTFDEYVASARGQLRGAR